MPYTPEYKPTNPADLLNKLQKTLGSTRPTADFIGTPVPFDENEEQFRRYAKSPMSRSLGFLPGRDNEEIYGQHQTFGNVMANAIVGAGSLGAHTFVDGWKGWGRMFDAVTSLDFSKLYDQGDLAEIDKRQKAVFDKYAIFSTEASRNSIFNKQFFGNLVQQSGFTLGTMAQVLSEEALVQVASAALAATGVGVGGAATVEAAEAAKSLLTVRKMFQGLEKLGDIYQSAGVMRKAFKGALPAIYDMYKAGKSGAGALELSRMGFGAIYRGVREANMAMTEARMESANTYGQMKGDLINDFVAKHGRTPDTKELEEIDGKSKDAAGTNFKYNSVIIGVSNRLQFDNILGGFKASSKVLREAEEAGKDLLTVTGKAGEKDAQKELTQVFEKSFKGVKDVYKEFGLRKALWEGTKLAAKPFAKIEVVEGLQENIQNISDKATRDYYTALYNHRPATAWESIKPATKSEFSHEGLVTFLQGALTGAITAPVNSAVGGINKLRTGKAGKTARDSRRADLSTLNEYLKDPTKILDDKVANLNAQTILSKGIADAAKNKDEFNFYNLKDSSFHKAITSALRMGKLDLLVDRMKDYADNLSPEEFKQAFPNIETENPKEFVHNLATRAEEIRQDWDNLHERFINPFSLKKGAIQAIHHIAFENVLEEMSYNRHAYRRAKQRYASLLNEVATDPDLANAGMNAFQDLTHRDRAKQLENMEAMDAAIAAASNPEERKALEKKKGLLQKWYEGADELLSESKIHNGYKAFSDYMKASTKDEDAIPNDALDKNFMRIRDIMKLHDKIGEHIEAINFLAEPKKFEYFFKRTKDALEDVNDANINDILEKAHESAKEANAPGGPPPTSGTESNVGTTTTEGSAGNAPTGNPKPQEGVGTSARPNEDRSKSPFVIATFLASIHKKESMDLRDDSRAFIKNTLRLDPDKASLEEIKNAARVFVNNVQNVIHGEQLDQSLLPPLTKAKMDSFEKTVDSINDDSVGAEGTGIQRLQRIQTELLEHIDEEQNKARIGELLAKATNKMAEIMGDNTEQAVNRLTGIIEGAKAFFITNPEHKAFYDGLRKSIQEWSKLEGAEINGDSWTMDDTITAALKSIQAYWSLIEEAYAKKRQEGLDELHKEKETALAKVGVVDREAKKAAIEKERQGKLKSLGTPAQILQGERHKMYNKWLPIAMKSSGLSEQELLVKIDKEGISKEAQKRHLSGDHLSNVEQFALYVASTRGSVGEVEKEKEEIAKINADAEAKLAAFNKPSEKSGEQKDIEQDYLEKEAKQREEWDKNQPKLEKGKDGKWTYYVPREIRVQYNPTDEGGGDVSKDLENDNILKAQLEQIKQVNLEALFRFNADRNNTMYTRRYSMLATTGKEHRPSFVTGKAMIIWDAETKRKYRIKRYLAQHASVGGFNIEFINDTSENKKKYDYVYEADHDIFLQKYPGYQGVVGVIVDDKGDPIKFDEEGQPSANGKGVIFTLPSSWDSSVMDFAQDKDTLYLKPVRGLTWSEFKSVIKKGGKFRSKINGVSEGSIQPSFELGAIFPTKEIAKDEPIHIAEAKSNIIFSPTGKQIVVADKPEHAKGGTYMFVGTNEYPVSIQMMGFEEAGLMDEVMGLIAELIDDSRYKDPDRVDEAVKYLRTLIVSGDPRTTLDLWYFKKDQHNFRNTMYFKVNGKVVTDLNVIREFLRTPKDPATPTRRMNVDFKRLNTDFRRIVGIGRYGKEYTKGQTYNDFIKEFSRTQLIVDEDNHPLLLNRYITFDQPSTVDEEGKLTAYEAPKVEEAPPERELTELEQIEKELREREEGEEPFTLDDELKRAKSLPATSGEVRETDFKKVARIFKASYTGQFSERHIRNLFNIVNSGAWGAWTSAGIKLYKGADRGTLYHEAWHEFTQLYLTKEQKDELYSEAKEVFGAKKSRKELEEDLAEGFREYALEDRKPKNALEKIWDFIKRTLDKLFGKTKQGNFYVDDMYEKLWTGRIGQYTPKMENIEFGLLKQGFSDKEGNLIFAAAKTHMMIKTIDGLIYDALIEAGVTPSRAFNDPKALEQVYNRVGQVIDRAIRARIELANRRQTTGNTAGYEQAMSIVRDLSEMRRHWQGVVNFHKENSEAFNIKGKEFKVDEEGNIISEQDSADDPSGEGYEGGRRKDLFDNSSGQKVSSIDGANKETRALVRGLKAMREDGQPFTNTWMFGELVNFPKTWNSIANVLAGSTSFEEMRRRLQAGAGKYHEFAQLIRLLPDPTVLNPTGRNFYYELDQITKFWQDFCRSNIPVYETVVEIDERRRPIYKFDEASKSNIDAIKNDFKHNFRVQDNEYVQVNTDGNNIVNMERGDNGHSKIYNDFYNRVAVEGDRRAKIDFLNAIGVRLSQDTKDSPGFDRAVSATDVGYIIDYLDRAIISKQQVTDPITQLSGDELGRNMPGYKAGVRDYEGKNNIFNKILRLESKFNITHASLSMRNAEGQMVYGLSFNNYLTTIVNVFNDSAKYQTLDQIFVANPHLQHLNPLVNPYMKNSVWLNAMFYVKGLYDEETGVKNPTYGQRKKFNGVDIPMRVGNYNGMKFENDLGTSSEGSTTTRMYAYDKLVMDINNMLYGAFTLMRTGDKSSEFFFGPTNFSPSEEQKLPVKIGDFASTFRDEKFMDIMKGYLEDELKRISLFANPNYVGHKLSYYGDTVKVDGVEGARGSFFNLFRDILTKELTIDLQKELRREVFELGTKPTAAIAKHEGRIRNAIDNFFKDQLVSLNENLSLKGYTKKDNYNWMGDAILKAADGDPITVLRAFLANQFISHVEQTKLIFGDGAFYKDFHKRSPAMTATGTIPMTETWFDEIHNRSNAREGFKDVAKYEAHDSIVNTAVFNDVEIPSIYGETWENNLDELRAANLSDAQHEADKRRILNDYGYMTKEQQKNPEKWVKDIKKFTEADAQGYITLPFYRYFKLAQGKWFKEHEDAYVKIMKGEPLSDKEMFWFMPIKAQHGGPLAEGGVYAPIYHKFSLMPLIPSMIKGTKLEKLNKLMIGQQVGYGTFKSGSKVTELTKGTKNPDGKLINDDFYSNYDEREALDDDYKFELNPVYMQYLKEQVNIDPHVDKEVIFASQMRKLVLMNLFNQGAFTGPRDLKILHDKYLDTVRTLTDIEKGRLYRELGIVKEENGTFVVRDIETFAKKLEAEAKKRDYNANVLDFIQYDKGRKDFKYPLDASVNSYQIQNLVMSIINNTVVRQMISGEMMVQGSSSGMEKYRKPTKEEEAEYGTNGLRFYHYDSGNKKVLAMQVKVPITHHFKNLLNREDVKARAMDANITPLEALNQLIKDEQWMQGNRESITMVGTRIPVQSLNSMEVMEVAEFLPEEAGDLCIVPSEIVVKAGSDFDIDKLFIFKPVIDKEGNHVKDMSRKEGIQNSLIETMNGIILHPHNFKQLISPNSNEQVKPTALRIRDWNMAKDRRKVPNYTGTEIYTYLTQIEKFNSGLIGKRTLGIAAVNNTFLQLFQYAGLKAMKQYREDRAESIEVSRGKFKTIVHPAEILVDTIINLVDHKDKDGFYDMSSTLDEKGVDKSKFTEQMINAYVDVLKDDFIFYANAGLDVAGVMFYLKTLGVGTDRIFYFINHPAIRWFVDHENRRKSEIVKKTVGKSEFITTVIDRMVHGGKVGDEIRPRMPEAQIVKVFGTEEYRKRTYGETKIPRGAKLRERIAKYAASIKEANPNFDFFGEKMLETAVSGLRQQEGFAKVDTLERIVVLNELANMMNQSEIFRKAQTTLNFDTNKSISQFDAQDKVDMEELLKTYGLFNQDALDKVRNESVVSSFGIQRMIVDIMNKIFPVTASRKFIEGVLGLIRTMPTGTTQNTKDRVVRTYRNDIILFILSRYTNLENGNSLGWYVHENRDMFHKMAYELIELTNKYPHLRRDYQFVQNLYPNASNRKRRGRVSNIRNIELARADNSTSQQDAYIEEWDKLLKHENPEISKWFKDLAYFAYFQSGLNRSPISFTDLIPNDVMNDLLKQGIDKYHADVEARGEDAVLKDYVDAYKANTRVFNEDKLDDDYRYKNYWLRPGSSGFASMIGGSPVITPGGEGDTRTFAEIMADQESQIVPRSPQKGVTSGMQGSLFAQPEHGIIFEQETSSGYKARTVKNASADATIAIAVDFNSAGEKLTKSSVLEQKKAYIPIDANILTVTPERVAEIVRRLNAVDAKTLNIAGNGIYTMKGKYTQAQVDAFTHELLKQVLASPDLKNKDISVRTGGQTGFDEAGAKAARDLGLPTRILAPKGWTFRVIANTPNGYEDISNEQQFKARFAPPPQGTPETKGPESPTAPTEDSPEAQAARGEGKVYTIGKRQKWFLLTEENFDSAGTIYWEGRRKISKELARKWLDAKKQKEEGVSFKDMDDYLSTESGRGNVSLAGSEWDDIVAARNNPTPENVAKVKEIYDSAIASHAAALKTEIEEGVGEKVSSIVQDLNSGIYDEVLAQKGLTREELLEEASQAETLEDIRELLKKIC